MNVTSNSNWCRESLQKCIPHIHTPTINTNICTTTTRTYLQLTPGKCWPLSASCNCCSGLNVDNLNQIVVKLVIQLCGVKRRTTSDERRASGQQELSNGGRWSPCNFQIGNLFNELSLLCDVHTQCAQQKQSQHNNSNNNTTIVLCTGVLGMR